MMRVFISHSSKDDTFVTQLAADLRAVGVEAWVDHEDIPPGANWDRLVEAALKSCEAMIVVLTPRSVESENVTDEWSYFLDENKLLYPVLAEGCEIPFRLRRRQRVDFTGERSGALTELLEVLGVQRIARLPFEPETILIPAGPFLMGSDPDKDSIASETERPQHTVILPGYRIGRYPVTVREYWAFIKAGGYQERHYWTDDGWQTKKAREWMQPHFWDEEAWTGDDRLPVIGVSWYEAYAYCQWLSEATTRPYHLPGEAEWEKAARSTDARIYPWGDDWQDGKCNTLEAGVGHVTPVGCYSPSGDSPYGASDMSGNVWEWCQTRWSQSYQEEDDPDGDFQRVVRGGSWDFAKESARTTARFGLKSHLRSYNWGFRVALSLDIRKWFGFRETLSTSE